MPVTNSPMEIALAEARRAGAAGEIPVGAVIWDPERKLAVAQAGNAAHTIGDPTAHAEMLAIRQAAESVGVRLDGLDMYVTLEPCAMCAGAIALARIRRLYFGAPDTKRGAVEHGARVFLQPSCTHVPELYGGIRETECAALLQEFFASLRAPPAGDSD